MESVTPGIPTGAIPIKDREAYYACPDGRIYSTRSKIFLKPGLKKDDRLHVSLPRLNRKPGERGLMTVDLAKIICTAFHGEKPTEPSDMTVSHLNGNVQDNRFENLAWETLEDNLLRRFEHGTIHSGFEHSSAKLLPEQIVYIQVWRKQGRTHKEIAQTLGVARTTITMLLCGKRQFPQEIEFEGEIPECLILKKES